MTTDTKILEVARSVRPDAWVDLASRGGFSVGFADNRDVEAYNADAAKVDAALKAAGFRVTVRPGDEHHARTIIRAR